MTTRELTLQERVHGFSHAARILYTDLNTTAGLTKTIAIYPESGTFPIGQSFKPPYAVKVHTPMLGASVSALTVACGDGGSTGRIAIAQDILTPALSGMTVMGLQNVATFPYSYQVADTLDLLFTAVGANLTALTAGDVEIFFCTFNFAALDSVA